MVLASATAAPFFEAANAGAKQVLGMLECKDDNEGCKSWAAGGECQRNPGFMHGACRKSCGRCELGGEDAQHALETIAVSVRNLHAGCSIAGSPSQCEGTGEQLSAVLAIMEERASGKALQRFIEALALEIKTVSSTLAPPATFTPVQPTPIQIAASVGVSNASAFVALSDGGQSA